MKMLSKWKLFLILGAICTLSLVACGDDDDNVPPEPQVTDVNGSYAGKAYYKNLAPATLTSNTPPSDIPSVAIDAEVKNDTISITRFPVEALVKTIVTNEEEANKLIEKIGDVNYRIGFSAALNAARDTINLELNPEPIEFSIPLTEENTLQITVNIEASRPGVYAIGKKRLEYQLKATVPGLFEEGFLLAFQLNKK